MKEVTFRIPEDATELVTELVEKLGGEVQQPKAKKRTVIKKSKSEKPDPLAFFGKYPDFPFRHRYYYKNLQGE